jgi:hypothetical protein
MKMLLNMCFIFEIDTIESRPPKTWLWISENHKKFTGLYKNVGSMERKKCTCAKCVKKFTPPCTIKTTETGYSHPLHGVLYMEHAIKVGVYRSTPTYITIKCAPCMQCRNSHLLLSGCTLQYHPMIITTIKQANV